MAGEPSAAFVRRVLTVVAIVTTVSLVVLLAWHAVSVLLTLFAGILLGVLLRGLAGWVSERTGLAQGRSLAIVCVVLTVVLGAGVALTAASITQEVSDMLDQLPGAVEKVKEYAEANPLGRRLVAPLTQDDGTVGRLPMSQVLGMASGTIGGLGTFLLIVFVGIFFAANPDVYKGGALLLVAPARRPRVEEVLDEVGETLLRWLAGRLLLMGVIGILSWIGLLLLGVPVALALALLAGLLSFIPNLGPIISAVPAMLIAATITPMLAVWVGALYLAIQTAESYLLEPLVVRKTVSLPPATNIGFQLFMGTWLGVMGLTLATPLLAVLTVSIRRLYVEDALGDPPSDADDGAA